MPVSMQNELYLSTVYRPTAGLVTGLRAVGVTLEDRQDLLGHKSGRMTTHYSAAEVGNLLAAVNRIANSRESPAGTVLRIVG